MGKTLRSYIKIKNGWQGNVETAFLCSLFASEAAEELQLIQLARKICQDADPMSQKEKADCIFNWVKSNFRYQRDPIHKETLQTPEVLMKTGFGDCDDMVTLVQALNMAVGNDCRLILISADPLEQEDFYFQHIYNEVLCGDKWTAYDVTVPRSYPGWEPEEYTRKLAVYPNRSTEALAGIFKKVFDAILDLFRDFEREIIRRPVKEIKRFVEEVYEWELLGVSLKDILQQIERPFREIRRTMRKIDEELLRFYESVQENLPSGLADIIILGTKILRTGVPLLAGFGTPGFAGGFGGFISPLGSAVQGLSALSPLLNTAASIAILNPPPKPLRLTEEDLIFLGKLVGGSIATILTGGGAASLAAGVLIHAGNLTLTAIEVKQAIDEKKEVLNKLKQAKIEVFAQEQARIELVKELERQIQLLNKFLEVQEATKQEIDNLKIKNNERLAQVRKEKAEENEEFLIAYEEKIVEEITDFFNLRISQLRELNALRQF